MMTIYDLLEKHEIKCKRISGEKNINIFSVGKLNVIFWINDGNVFKMRRKWMEQLSNKCDEYALFLFDKKAKKYYYVKFRNKNNWLNVSYINCDKEELFLGKQILNYPSTIAKFIADVKKYDL